MEGAEKQNVVYFGRTDFRNEKKLFGIKREDRRQHTYIIGKTGTGKSVLLENLIKQDIHNGEGLAIVDPHGELVETLLHSIPEHRKNDVVYFNPSDTEYHIGFNPLEVTNPKHKHLVASGLMGIFTKIWANVWSARMEYILNNAVLALLDTPGSTLLGITRILVDKDYRQKIVNNVRDPVVRSFWMNEFEEWQDRFRNEAIAPIQNKVGQFLSTALIRNVVGQAKSTIDIFEMMNSRKIFLVNVSKGRIGEDNSALLGAMLITKIQLASMERVRVPEEEREDFYLYVDEFQNFATDSFASVLSEARKYRLNLIIAHQYVGQLITDVSTKVRDAVFGNAGTLMMFRVGAADAEFLEKEFEPEFDAQDMVNLPNYHIYLRLMVDGMSRRPFSATTLAPFKPPADALNVEEIVRLSRERYAKPKEEVEETINKWAGNMPDDINVGESNKKTSRDGRKTVREGEFVKAACSVPGCERVAKLRFEPDPNRPIYCSSHLEALEKGEIEPVKILRAPSAHRYERAVSGLSGMGIEFELGDKKKKKKRRRRHKGGPAQEQPLSSLRKGEVLQKKGKESDKNAANKEKEELKKMLG